ncbi:MAG: hypothetical protein PVI79_09810 [Gammaproteobacteria bacterium]
MKVLTSAVSVAALLGALQIQPVCADDNRETFRKLDIDNDGFISEYEALAHDALPDDFEEGDENSDGLIDLDEFLKLEISDD